MPEWHNGQARRLSRRLRERVRLDGCGGDGIAAPRFVSADAADVVELNHFFDGDGRPVFDQVIFWQWHAEEGAYHVRAWRLWKSPTQTPWRDWSSGGFMTAWFDGDRLRVVRAASYRETWTQHDPELEDREFFPAYERRGLTHERMPPLPSDSRPASSQ